MHYNTIQAEMVHIKGLDDEEIEAYLARPLGPGPFPAMVVLHPTPGWDEGIKEIARSFAVHGYIAISPHLHHREGGPEVSPEEAAAVAKDAGGVPDARYIGDVRGAIRYLETYPSWNHKVGSIGYCSGGRQSYIFAASEMIDAAVVCYGGNINQTPERTTPNTPVPPIDMTENISCPILWFSGADDKNPSPADAMEIEATLKKYDKQCEFVVYEGAGHAFFATHRTAYRPQAAVDGWSRIWKFLENNLVSAPGVYR